MSYDDEFLMALGAWQNGWREDADRRRAITEDLLRAIAALRQPLPRRSPPPVCYRKRFLLPNNPQNDEEMRQLVLTGGIRDGPAAWTTDPEFGRAFKDLLRPGHITALFEHRPSDAEVLVDIPHLWTDPAFADAVTAFAAAGGLHANALQHFNVRQSELILDAPMSATGIIGFTGQIGTYDELFEMAGAHSEAEQDDLIDRIIAANSYPGQARWLGRDGSQRVLTRTRERFERRITRLVWARLFRAGLMGASSHSSIARASF